MKKKKIDFIVVGLIGTMAAASLTGCGTRASATDVQILEESISEAVMDSEEIIVNGADAAAESEDLVIFEDLQGESIGEIDAASFITLETAVTHELIGDTDIYNAEGYLAGYVKAGTVIDFSLIGTEWVGFSSENGDKWFMRMEDAEKNIKYEEESETAGSETASGLAEDITDGNIVLYGGEKYPEKYMPLDDNEIEEISIEVKDAESDIPLYCGEGRLCGHLNQGGSIVLTGHCTPATGWYRFENPIEGTEYKYLYMMTQEVVMSDDEKAYIENALLETSGGRITVLDALDADMKCYEFSIAREGYGGVGNYLYGDEFDAAKYRTFYIECSRNGDFFDCKVYYK